jgi:Ferritin-like domain
VRCALKNVNVVDGPALDPQKSQEQINLVKYKRALARRNFIKNVGLASAGIAAGAIVEGCGIGGGNAMAGGPSPDDVLNFALNLEYLEAEFYSVATSGQTLGSSVIGGSSMATGGNQVTFTDTYVADTAAEIAQDEMEHVKFLRTALPKPVAEPAINLAALGIGFASQAEFLTLARAFEDTGVSAYAGAATLLTSNKTYLQAAAQILATEAYHAGNLRLSCILKNVAPFATDSMDIPPYDPAIDSGGAATSAHYFPTDSNGLAITRTPSQVLMIVYNTTNTGVTSGGFFPSGLNGNIKST